jgi:hypothetical protein
MTLRGALALMATAAVLAAASSIDAAASDHSRQHGGVSAVSSSPACWKTLYVPIANSGGRLRRTLQNVCVGLGPFGRQY